MPENLYRLILRQPFDVLLLLLNKKINKADDRSQGPCLMKRDSKPKMSILKKMKAKQIYWPYNSRYASWSIKNCNKVNSVVTDSIDQAGALRPGPWWAGFLDTISLRDALQIPIERPRALMGQWKIFPEGKLVPTDPQLTAQMCLSTKGLLTGQ